MLVSSPRCVSPSVAAKQHPSFSYLGSDSSSGGCGGGIALLAVASGGEGDLDGADAAAAISTPPTDPSSPLGFPSGLVSVDSLWAAAAAALVESKSLLAAAGTAPSGGVAPPAAAHQKRARSGSMGSAELGEGVVAAAAAAVAAHAAVAAAGNDLPPTPAQRRPHARAPPLASSARPPRPAPPLDPGRLVAAWASLPTAVPVPGVSDGSVITLVPALWRAPASSGGGAVVTLAARVVAAAAPAAAAAATPSSTAGATDALAGVLFTCLNPRVVTTGVPGRPGAAEIEAAALAAAGGEASPSCSSPTLPALAAPASVFASSSSRGATGRISIAEAVLVRRPPAGPGPALDLWHLPRPPPDDGGGALPGTPAWPGEWLIDVAARVTDGTGGSVWLRIGAPKRLPAA